MIDKPAGLVVNRSETVKEKTLQDWLEERLKIKGKKGDSPEEIEFFSRGGIVHRLDKETSGLLVGAKNPGAFLGLKNQFKERTVLKKYLALVHGQIKPEEGTISVPVGRLPFKREKFGIVPEGRPARTDYKVLETFDQKQMTLVEMTPHTGRTHQIRVHLKYLGYPIVADLTYAGRKRAKKDRLFCPRLFLHACFLSIKHPKTGKILEFKSNLPPDLANFLLKL